MSQVELATAVGEPSLSIEVDKPSLDFTLVLTGMDALVTKAELITVDPLAVV